jgi:hypothetical protein
VDKEAPRRDAVDWLDKLQRVDILRVDPALSLTDGELVIKYRDSRRSQLRPANNLQARAGSWF